MKTMSLNLTDIVPTSTNFIYNFHITPGPSTFSDHEAIVMNIYADPIQVSCSHKKRYSKANWEKYKKKRVGKC